VLVAEVVVQVVQVAMEIHLQMMAVLVELD
jgi:hypothetical protein